MDVVLRLLSLSCIFIGFGEGVCQWKSAGCAITVFSLQFSCFSHSPCSRLDTFALVRHCVQARRAISSMAQNREQEVDCASETCDKAGADVPKDLRFSIWADIKRRVFFFSFCLVGKGCCLLLCPVLDFEGDLVVEWRFEELLKVECVVEREEEEGPKARGSTSQPIKSGNVPAAAD